jgi:hypothetical protein
MDMPMLCFVLSSVFIDFSALLKTFYQLQTSFSLALVFSSPELKAQVSYSDRPLSGVRLSVCPSVCPSVCLSVRL